MKLLVVTLFIAAAVADVSQLGYSYHKPDSSYEVGQKSVTDSIFSSTTPGANLHLPVHGHQDFGASVTNVGATGYSQPIQFQHSIGGAGNIGAVGGLEGSVVSTTVAPSVNFQQDFVSSTVAPSVSFNQGFTASNGESGLGSGLGFNQGFVSSTPAPSSELYGSSTPSSLNQGFSSGASNFEVHGLNYGQGSPLVYANQYQQLPGFNFNGASQLNAFNGEGQLNAFNGAGQLNAFNGASQLNAFNGASQLNAAPVEVSNAAFFAQGQSYSGSLNDAFGVSTPGPIVSGDYSDAVAINSGPAEVTKRVYFFASPDADEEVRPRINVIQQSPRKNIQVVFVKAPAAQLAPKIQITAPQQTEDKTLVYVLVKKPEELHQTVQLQSEAPKEPSKPEVFFIKYKNQQEAEQAISEIQAGQARSQIHVSANNIGGSDFVNSIHLEKNAQPVVNYVKASNVGSSSGVGNAGVQFSSGQSNLGLNSGFGFTTAAPISSGATYTASPSLKLNGVGSSFVNSGLNHNSGFNSGFSEQLSGNSGFGLQSTVGNFNSGVATNSGAENVAFGSNSGFENVNSGLSVNSGVENVGSGFALNSGVGSGNGLGSVNLQTFHSQPGFSANFVSSTPSTVGVESFGVSSPSVSLLKSQGTVVEGGSSFIDGDINSNLINGGGVVSSTVAPGSFVSRHFESSSVAPVSFSGSGSVHVPFAKYESPFQKREVKKSA